MSNFDYPGKSWDAELRKSIYTRNLESMGCVVTFYEAETAFDIPAFAQVNYGDRIAYQGPADERYTSFAHGFTQAEWMLKGENVDLSPYDVQGLKSLLQRVQAELYDRELGNGPRAPQARSFHDTERETL